MHDNRNSPLIILGIDAGDPTLIRRWANEGLLPNIKSIMDRGCWGNTAGPELLSEHGVWLSIFSGLSRGEHGCYYFRQLKPGAYDLEPITGHDLNVPPFWATLAGGAKRVVAIDIPDILPVPGLAGIQLANWAIHLGWVSKDPKYAPCAEPAAYLRDADRVFGPRMNIIENSVATVDEDREIFRQLTKQVECRGKLLRHAAAQGKFDLLVTVFAETHTGTHQFWRYRPEADGADARRDPELSAAIRDLYVATDREIGLLLKELPADANVVIVSSVGIGDFQPTSGIVEDFCRKLGYQAAPEPAAFSMHPMSLARRLLPEWVRVMLSKRLSRETRERLLADQFRGGTNWSKTTAFSIPSFYSGFIRINLRGREPQGTVEPGAEYEQVMQRLENDIRQLIDPATGQSPVQILMRGTELAPGGPPRVLPDLFIVWKEHRHFMKRLLHPRAEIVQELPEWVRNSDHVRRGFFAGAGPDIAARGDIGDRQIIDLAPSFLALMEEPKSAQLRGDPIPGLGAKASVANA